MSLIFKKLREARFLLNLRQIDVETQTGMSQHMVSQMERGERLGVPLIYWQFLHQKGIDIAAILNDNITAEDFRRNPKNINLSLRADLSAANIRIKKLEDVVNNYSENIQDLRGQVGELQKKLDSRNPESKKGEQAG